MYVVFKNDKFDRVEEELPLLESEEYLSYKVEENMGKDFYDFFIDKASNLRLIPKRAWLIDELKHLKLRHRIKYILQILRG